MKRRRLEQRDRKEREFIRGLAQEVRFAVRRLLKAPGLALAAVITLTLGIGATATIFSVVNGVVLSPLPYPESDRLVWLDHSAPGIGALRGLNMTPGLYVHYRNLNRTLDDLGIYFENDLTITGNGDPERISATFATATLFTTLGVPPVLGRALNETDNVSTGGGSVVLSHRLWSRRYGADPSIIGRTIQLNGIAIEVVGVMPPDFAFPSRDTQLWIPLVVNPASNRLGGFNRKSVARLKTGVSAEEAQAELQILIPRLKGSFAGAERVVDDARLTALVVPLKRQILGNVEQTLWILLGTVAIVLLIACANVANLFLVRAESRQRDIAVRTALGASRGNIARQFLSESTILTFVGGVLGLGFAFGGVRLLVSLGPSNIPRLSDVTINGTVLLFTTGISLFASLLFGAIPGIRRVPDLVASLKDGGRGSTTGHARFRTRNVLVVSQVALALILLVGAGLMTRSFWHLTKVDPGFSDKNVLTFQIGLTASDHPSRESAVAFHHELLQRLKGLPGVEEAGAVTCLPLCANWSGSPLQVEGITPEPGAIPPIVANRRVSAGFFETLKIPVIAGRTIEPSDHERRSGAAVVNEELARLYFPGEDPIGKRVHHDLNATDPVWYRIVGVVRNVPVGKLTDDPSPTIFLPLLHGDSTRGVSPYTLTYVVRSSIPPLDLMGTVRKEIWGMDPNLPISQVRTMEKVVADAGIQMAFTMLMLMIAAAVAVLLGTVGIYGVVSYVVSQRTGEIGVRVALGAKSQDVSRMVLKQGGAVALAGIALGLVGAFGLTRFMRALLYGVAPGDPLTFGAVAVLLLAVKLAATYVPARRAAAINPVDALRSE